MAYENVRRCCAECEFFLSFPDGGGRCFYTAKGEQVGFGEKCKYDLQRENALKQEVSPEERNLREIYHIR